MHLEMNAMSSKFSQANAAAQILANANEWKSEKFYTNTFTSRNSNFWYFPESCPKVTSMGEKSQFFFFFLNISFEAFYQNQISCTIHMNNKNF